MPHRFSRFGMSRLSLRVRLLRRAGTLPHEQQPKGGRKNPDRERQT